MSIKIRFHGAVRTVTGSLHTIQNGTSRIAIDCGLFQGHRQEFYERNSSFPFEPSALDAVVLSHAHIDHSGNIPNLIKKGFNGKIFCTSATEDLCSAMLPDSGHIQEEDAKFVSKIHRKKGLPPVHPLYTRKEAEDSLEFFQGESYHESFEVAEGFEVSFLDAGHVLGSTNPIIKVKDGDGEIKIGYAVDLGRKDIPILKDPEMPEELDYLFLESTYGGRYHTSIDEAKDILCDTVNRTVKRGGKIIIPSFALERTQEVAYYLNQLLMEDRIPDIPIYVDSPLAVNITDVFLRHPECFDEEMLEAFKAGDDPLGAKRINYITDVNDSKRLNEIHEPMVIISASGMCEAGRILHHLRNNIENPKNTVLIVGYMARNTLGRKLVEREEKVKIFGLEHPLRAEVVVINAFSAHADRNDLLNYALKFKGKVKNIFIVHGDEDQSEALLELLTENGLPAHLPVPDEEVEIS